MDTVDTVTKDPEAERTPRERSALAAAQAAALEVEVLRDMLSEGLQREMILRMEVLRARRQSPVAR